MIINKDCLIAMKEMESESIDCILTDPPYGLKFMGKDWDCGVPGVEFWKEAHRISKKGTILAAFGGTRTFHRLTCAIEDAGWEIKDCMMWLYGSGFPKAKTCLKPAWEPIIIARKKGVNRPLNIDACRIPTEDILSIGTYKKNLYEGGLGKGVSYGQHVAGRWPANLILDEEARELLDEQTGILKSGLISKHHKINKNRSSIFFDGLKEIEGLQSFGDSGVASRFFYCAKASPKERNEGLKGMPLKIGGGLNATIHGDSRTGHISRQKNIHPTVKPLALMEYLIKLIMPPQGILLDPFCGSGSTLVAAKKLGINAIGIELNSEYCEIAEKRVANVKFESE